MRFGHAVVIGRFAPVCVGDLALFRGALAQARQMLVLVAAAGTPRGAMHPFTFEEREIMIRAALGDLANRVTARPLCDHLYVESAWIAEAQQRVAEALAATPDEPTALFVAKGGRIDGRAFPQWDHVGIEADGRPEADDFRRCLFSDDEEALALIEEHVPPPVFSILRSFRATPHYEEAREEFAAVLEQRAAWDAAPFPPVFVTVDSVVTQSGHVLLVRRKQHPGRGLFALPGGFVNPNEKLYDAALRELREETKLDLGGAAGAMRARQVFDRPERSLRGRIITHAFHFHFPSGPLPQVEGGDDAATAEWKSFAELRSMRSLFFEDHFSILEFFLGGT